jgi:peptidoglycan/LPS O-acetylase OafA/YrhL
MTAIAGAPYDEPVPATRARLTVGDPLRAIAALAVFGVHMVGGAVEASGYGGRLGLTDHFASLYGFPGYVFDSGNSGVWVFFALSGYLLTRPFLRAYIGDEPMPSVRRYLRNRALRILPAFWVVLALAFVFYGTRGDTFWQSVGLAGFVSSFKASGMHDVFGQPWSLAIEARFYLLLPLAALAFVGVKRALGARLPRWARIALILVLVAIGFDASADFARTDGPFYESFGTNASFFAPGIVLAVLEHVLPSRARAHRLLRLAAAPVFVAGFALTFLSHYLLLEVLSPPYVRYLPPLATGMLVGGPLLWQWTGGDAWRALDIRVLRWIGERSYSLFLVHSLILVAVAPHVVAGGYKLTLVTLGITALALSLLASALLYRYVEQPALRHKASQTRSVPEAKELPAASEDRRAVGVADRA